MAHASLAKDIHQKSESLKALVTRRDAVLWTRVGHGTSTLRPRSRPVALNQRVKMKKSLKPGAAAEGGGDDGDGDDDEEEVEGEGGGPSRSCV